MKGLLVAMASVALLQGCAYLQAHVAQVVLVGTVAGAVASTESAVVNGIELKEKLTK